MTQGFARKNQFNSYTFIEKYDTGWISRSDWTNVSPGSDTTKNTDSNVAHNLNANLSDLLVSFLVATDSIGSNAFELYSHYYYDGGGERAFGFTMIDSNNIQVNIPSGGVNWIQTNNAGRTLDDEDWFYRIIVYKLK